MTKKDVAAEVALRTGITKKQALKIINDIMEEIKKALARDEKVELRRFGVFKVRYAKEKIGRNLSTGAPVVIPPARRVKFIPGKEFKTLLNRYYASRLANDGG